MIGNSDRKIINTMMKLISFAVTGQMKELVTDGSELAHIYKISKAHDLAHLIYYCLQRRGMLSLCDEELTAEFRERYDLALYRHVMRTVATGQIRSALNNAGVPYIFLKGAVLSSMYPEKWMRTSSDIDVLVKQEDYKKADDALISYGFKKSVETEHDVSLLSPDNVHVELHRTLIEDRSYPLSAAVLDNVWNDAVKASDGCEYKMSGEMFYLYHIAHMVKHFENGGCGIRPLIDLFLLNNGKRDTNAAYTDILERAGMLKFAEKASNTAYEWMTADSVTFDDFAEYVIEGGVYGTVERAVEVRAVKLENSHPGYYASRIFAPLHEMKISYPVLEKCPFFLPFCWFARLFRLLNRDARKRAVREIEFERSVNPEKREKIEAMMKKLQIWK